MTAIPITQLPTLDCAQQLAQRIAQQLTTNIEQKDQATLIVSGGKTPIALFQQLSLMDLPWQKVQISLVDDRCVPSQHADSNAWLVTNHLLRHCAQKAQFIPLLPNAQLDPPQNLAEWQLSHAQNIYTQLQKADILLLGMGEDGHIASIFSQATNYADLIHAKANCLWVDQSSIPPNMPQHHRVTWNLPAIIKVSNIFLLAYGEVKLKLIEQAQQGLDRTMPVSQLFHHRTSSLQIWLGI